MLYGDFELFWSRNMELKKQNSSLLDDKRHLHTQLISVKSELQDVASELKQSKLLLNNKNQEYEELNYVFSKSKEAVETLKDTLTNKNDECNRLGQELVEETKKSNDLHFQNQILFNQIKEVKEANSSTEKKCEELETLQRSQLDEISQLKKEVLEETKKKQSFLLENQNMSNNMSEDKEACKILRKICSKLEINEKSHLEQISKQKEKFQKETQKKNDLILENKNLSNNLSKIKEEHSNLKKKCDDL